MDMLLAAATVAGAIAAVIGAIYVIRSRRTPQPVRVVDEARTTQTTQPAAHHAVPDFPMGFRDFDQRILPELLQEGWEVKKPRPERVWLLQQEGWEEIYRPNAQGQQARVVIVEPLSGRVGLVPMRRRKTTGS